MKVETPAQQHEAMARKILARRKNNKSNTVPEGKKVKVNVEPAKPVVAPAKVADEVETVNPYEGLGKKELRLECDGRGITYKKKTTIAQLIELLEAK